MKKTESGELQLAYSYLNFLLQNTKQAILLIRTWASSFEI